MSASVLQPVSFSARERFWGAVEKGIPALMGLYVFLNPFPATAFKEISFYGTAFLLLILISCGRFRPSFRSPLTLPFALFLSWAVVTLFFARDFDNSIRDVYGHLLKYLFLYFILINFFNTREMFLRLAGLVVLSSTFFVAGCFVYYYFIAGFPLSSRLALGLDVVHTSLIALNANFALILALHVLMTTERPSLRGAVFIPVLIFSTAILMSQTRSALIAIVFAVSYLLFRKYKRAIIIFVVLLLIIVLATPLKDRFTGSNNPLRNERLSTFYMTMLMIKDHPITGIGYGMQTFGKEDFLKYYYMQVPPGIRHEIMNWHPHNMLLDTAVRTGLVGLAFFMLVLISYWRMGRRVERVQDEFYRGWGRCLQAGFIALFIEGLFEPTLSHYPAITLYTAFAMMTILWNLSQGGAACDGTERETQKLSTQAAASQQ
jgi:putative inorganic carbon (HCO3(-)) transporter